MRKTTKVNKHRNRMISMLLVICLLVGIVPIRVSASADETNAQNNRLWV